MAEKPLSEIISTVWRKGRQKTPEPPTTPHEPQEKRKVETAVVSLSVATAVLAILCAVLAGTVPYLAWKVFRLEQQTESLKADVNKLDEAMAALLQTLQEKK